MTETEHLTLIDWSSAPGDAEAQAAAASALLLRAATAEWQAVRAYGDWAGASEAAATLFAAGIELRHVPAGGSISLTLACDLCADLFAGHLPASVSLEGDAFTLAPLSALLRGRGVRVAVQPLRSVGAANAITRAERGGCPDGLPQDAPAASAAEGAPAVANANLVSEHAESGVPAQPNGARPIVAHEPAEHGDGPCGDATGEHVAPTATPPAAAHEPAPFATQKRAATGETVAEEANQSDVARPAAPTAAAAQPAPSPDEELRDAVAMLAMALPFPDTASPADGVARMHDTADASGISSAAAVVAPTPPPTPELVWTPRARGGASSHAQSARPSLRSLPPVEKPLLDAKQRRRLREILKSVYLPEGRLFSGEPRQRTIDALCRNSKGIDERWWDFPDEVARGLLGLHICILRYIQQNGVDHVSSADLSAAFDNLRHFSATRYPGNVYGFAGDDIPLGSSWLEDARVRLLTLEQLVSTTRPTGVADRASAIPPAAAASVANVAGGDATAALAVCGNGDCARLAGLLFSGRQAHANGGSAHCGICHGSNTLRATLGLAADLRAHGLSRLLVVGGEPAARQQLAERLAAHGIELRGVDGDQPSPSEREANADLVWAQVVVIWTQRLLHKVSGHYADVCAGVLQVWVTRGGVTQLCVAVRDRLTTWTASASA